MDATTVELKTPTGKTTGPMPIDTFLKVSRQIKAAAGSKKPKLAVVADQPDKGGQAEAFSPEETGQAQAERTTRDQLRSFVERIERLEEEKKTIAEDISHVYGEAKSMGFNAKVLRRVVAIRKIDRDERIEQEAILQTYLIALGMEE